MDVPEGLRYTEEHEWAAIEGGLVKVGITDFAQDALGDIVFIELPQAGSRFGAGEAFGVVESVKAVSDLYMPVAGEIVEANEPLAEAPETINSDPYGRGWLIKIKPTKLEEINALMDAVAYNEYCAKAQG